MDAASLAPFFTPRAVAVVGASRTPTAVGHRVVLALRDAGFRGRIYPVNPNAETIAGLACHPSVAALPEAPDLAVIAVPTGAVLEVVAACGERGTRAVVVLTAGFAETDRAGRARQAALLDAARAQGIRLIGPNCLGLLSTEPSVRLNASFSPVFPPAGHVAMASESGALGLSVLSMARERDLGLSAFVSLGNRADVSSNDLLAWWAGDPRTRVILLYLESFGNARRFAALAREVGRTKPIVAVKSGRTPAGRRAAGSHTAALAADDVAVDALFAQTGVLRASTIDDLFDVAALLASQPPPPGGRVALLTNAGGPAILCADVLAAEGLALAALDGDSMDALARFLPAAATLDNPVDMLAAADATAYRRAVEILLSTPSVDALIVLFIPLAMAPAADVHAAIAAGVEAGRARGGAGKPVLAVLMAGHEPGRSRALAAGEEHVPVYPFPEPAAHALAMANRHAAWRARPVGHVPPLHDVDPAAARAACRAAAARAGGWLSAREARALLAAFGLPVAPGGVARDAAAASALAAAVGYPVALKAASHRILHKTEVGGVRLDLADETAVRAAFDDVTRRAAAIDPRAAADGVLVQPMLRGGVEILVGVTVDPLFGPLVGFGLGGIHVEILGDVAFRVAPLTDRDAAELVDAIRGRRLLDGYRGHPAADRAAIADLLARVSALAMALPELVELDLNPVLAGPEGCVIVDARARVVPDEPAGGG